MVVCQLTIMNYVRLRPNSCIRFRTSGFRCTISSIISRGDQNFGSGPDSLTFTSMATMSLSSRCRKNSTISVWRVFINSTCPTFSTYISYRVSLTRDGSAARMVLTMTFSLGWLSMYWFQAESICSGVNAERCRCDGWTLAVGVVLFPACWLFIMIRGMLPGKFPCFAGAVADVLLRGVYATLGSEVLGVCAGVAVLRGELVDADCCIVDACCRVLAIGREELPPPELSPVGGVGC